MPRTADRRRTGWLRIRSRGRASYCSVMASLRDLMKAVSDMVTGGRRQGDAPPPKTRQRGRRQPAAHTSPESSRAAAHGQPAKERVRSSDPGAEDLPGQLGPDATVEVDPHRIGRVRLSYSPHTEGAPDPGEVVWTWVPRQGPARPGGGRPIGGHVPGRATHQQGPRRRGRLCVHWSGWVGWRAPTVVGKPGSGVSGARRRNAPGGVGPAPGGV
jgi:hypothetical protein